MSLIDSTALVDPKAELGNNVNVGPHAVIEAGTIIGDNTEIGYNAVIAKGARIGNNCRIFTGAVISTEPQDLKFEDEETFVQIGDQTTVREYATINRATTHSYYTKIGNSCLIMAYAHVAHDCQLGDNVIIANSVNMAGHVIIEDYVGIGGMTPIHQFVRIGAHSFIGGGIRIPKDVPPYILAMGTPATYGGLNSVGLQRRGFSADTLNKLKKAYKIIYRENLTQKEAIEKIDKTIDHIPEIEHLLSFLKGSERGIIR